MSHVNEVQWIDACRFDSASGPKLLVQSLGEVPTSHWSDIRLAPRYAVEEPPDGLMEFDFKARPPSGRVLDSGLKVAASIVVACPPWLRGIKIFAACNSESLSPVRVAQEQGAPGLPLAHGSGTTAGFAEQPLAVYEDHFETGPPGPRRRLRHQFALSIQGPDLRRILQCIDDVAASHLAAAVAAAYPCGGPALTRAVGSLVQWLNGDLGGAYQIHLDDRARWVDAQESWVP
jgi:hypothetical protein